MSQITPHILVVDDDTRLRRLLKKYLTENGFIVSQASGAQEAKELLKLFSFSILILDVMMPGQNGQELTKELRANGFETPILMLTAMGDIDNRIIGLEAGADDYLSKPFEPKELLLRINNILKRQIQHEVKKEVCFGDCVYDIKTKRLLKNDSPVLLTTAEQDLLNVLDRMALFVTDYDKNGVFLKFTSDGFEIRSQKSNAVELLAIKSETPIFEFSCLADIEMLKSQVGAVIGDIVNIYYGQPTSLKIKEGNTTMVLSLMQNNG